MSAERESSVDPIVYEVRESRGRGEEMEIGQERERHAAARTPPAPRLLLLLSNDGRSAPRASALAGSSFPSSSPPFFLFCFPAGPGAHPRSDDGVHARHRPTPDQQRDAAAVRVYFPRMLGHTNSP